MCFLIIFIIFQFFFFATNQENISMNGENSPFLYGPGTVNNEFSNQLLHRKPISYTNQVSTENKIIDNYDGLYETFCIESESKSFSLSQNLQEPSKEINISKSTKNSWGDETYSELITKAIKSSSGKKLVLSEIYEWIFKNYPSIANESRNWKVSLSYSFNLKIHKC